jgi:hypothetical protein
MCKLCWASTAALGLLFLAFVGNFMVTGATELSSDGRTTIVVTPAQREQVLGEMRGLLEAVQTIIVANNAGDLHTVAVTAREVGKENMDPHSAEFSAKLPMGFRKLGMDTHARFDLLALDAEQVESMEQVSQQLGVLTGNCVACHRAYRLATNEVE